MSNLILFDQHYQDLLPLTFTRPVAALRIGVLTIQQKWEQHISRYFPAKASFATAAHLSKKYPTYWDKQNLLINASLLPTFELVEYLCVQMPDNTMLLQGETVIALKCNEEKGRDFLEGKSIDLKQLQAAKPLLQIQYSWDIFSNNAAALELDFALLTTDRQSQAISSTNQVIGDSRNIFLEEGAWVECATLNASSGSIYIGKNATVMEGCNIRGGLALCEESTLKMAAKIYGATTIGPHSKIGGEVNNSVITGYSNKGHDGFLGNAVLGQWCNLGADTNNSNLKNNYSEVKGWNYSQGGFIPTGKQFCGLVMGDHSKTGINSMFNTGTTVGAFCNVYGSDFPRTFIPSFSWGSSKGFVTHQLDKAIATADRVMQRRHKQLDETEREIIEAVFEQTATYRKF